MLDEAERQLRAALKLTPGSAEAATRLGMVLAQKGRWSEAIAQYRRALEINPNFEEARMNLDLALRRQ